MPISGANAATHTTVSADLQHNMTCAVTASNSAGDSAPATSAAVLVTATTVLTERQTNSAGTILACGGATTTACRVRSGATTYFAGTAKPIPVPAAARAVTVSYYRLTNGVWRLQVTKTVSASSTTGAWRAARLVTLKGSWRARATTAARATLTAGASAYRYYMVF